MKQLILYFIILCHVGGIIDVTAHAQDERPSQAKATLIRAGRLVDVNSGTYKTDQGVLVENGLIKEVGTYDAIRKRSPRNVHVIDLSRSTLLPGLIDCHSHLFSANEGRDDTTGSMTEAQRREVGERNAREYLEAGVTTVRNLGYGLNADALLRDRINVGVIPGPRIFAATRKLTPPGGQGVTPESAPDFIRQFAEVSGGPENARRVTREVISAGADVIKVVVDVGNRLLSSEEIRAIVEEAHNARRKVAAHATSAVAIKASVEAGVDSIEHGTEASEEMLRVMAERGIFLVPTSFTEQMMRDIFASELRQKPTEQADFEAFLRDYKQKAALRMKLALGAKVRIATGSDMIWRYPGRTRGQSALLNLEALRNEGMKGEEVIRAATIAGADLLGLSNRVGSVEVGKQADVIAVDGDPLSDVTVLQRVRFVMKGGLVIKGAG